MDISKETYVSAKETLQRNEYVKRDLCIYKREIYTSLMDVSWVEVSFPLSLLSLFCLSFVSLCLSLSLRCISFFLSICLCLCVYWCLCLSLYFSLVSLCLFLHVSLSPCQALTVSVSIIFTRVCVSRRVSDSVYAYISKYHTQRDCQRASATSAGFRTHDNANELSEFPKIL